MRGALTLQEILEQPAAWTAAIEAHQRQAERVVGLFEARSPSQVIFTGCGSS